MTKKGIFFTKWKMSKKKKKFFIREKIHQRENASPKGRKISTKVEKFFHKR